jgi:hypothetical protein
MLGHMSLRINRWGAWRAQDELHGGATLVLVDGKHGDREGSPLLYALCRFCVYSSGDPCGHHVWCNHHAQDTQRFIIIPLQQSS